MPSIAIIGAGPAGLTLARLLLVYAKRQSALDLQLTVFEHDASPTARWQQGGTLDLHYGTGIAALKAAQMWDDILPVMRYEGEELIFADMNATRLIHIQGLADIAPQAMETERPEVDREVLKQYLLKAVEQSGGKYMINWNKHLVSTNDKTGILTFKDGSEAGPFDLVVGADGAWSKIRNVLTDVKPSYSGISGFEGRTDREYAGADWERVSGFTGKGSMFSFSQQKSVMAQKMGDGSIKTAVWRRAPEAWATDLVKKCGEEEGKMREALLNEISDWDEQLKDLVRCSRQYRQWSLYELPVGHTWEHRKGFTLIGDSAHLMTPFAGEGVNAAMKDALELADHIDTALKGTDSLDEAVRKFEQEMTPRNTKIQLATAHNRDTRFAENAPLGYLAGTPKMLAAESGYDTTKGWMYWALKPASAIAYLAFWSLSRYGTFRRWMRGT